MEEECKGYGEKEEAQVRHAIAEFCGWTTEQCNWLQQFLIDHDAYVSGGFVAWALAGRPAHWHPTDIDIFVPVRVECHTTTRADLIKMMTACDEIVRRFQGPMRCQLVNDDENRTASIPALLDRKWTYSSKLCRIDDRDIKLGTVDIIGVSDETFGSATWISNWIVETFDFDVCTAMWPLMGRNPNKCARSEVIRLQRHNEKIIQQTRENKTIMTLTTIVAAQQQAFRYAKYCARGFNVTIASDIKKSHQLLSAGSVWKSERNSVTSRISIAHQMGSNPKDHSTFFCTHYKAGNTLWMYGLRGDYVENAWKDTKTPFVLDSVADSTAVQVRSPVPLESTTNSWRFVGVFGALPPPTIHGVTWTSWPIHYIPLNMLNDSSHIRIALTFKAQISALAKLALQPCPMESGCLWKVLQYPHVHYNVEDTSQTLLLDADLAGIATRRWDSECKHEDGRVCALRDCLSEVPARIVTEYMSSGESWSMVWNTDSWFHRTPYRWFQEQLDGDCDRLGWKTPFNIKRPFISGVAVKCRAMAIPSINDESVYEDCVRTNDGYNNGVLDMLYAEKAHDPTCEVDSEYKRQLVCERQLLPSPLLVWLAINRIDVRHWYDPEYFVPGMNYAFPRRQWSPGQNTPEPIVWNSFENMRRFCANFLECKQIESPLDDTCQNVSFCHYVKDQPYIHVVQYGGSCGCPRAAVIPAGANSKKRKEDEDQEHKEQPHAKRQRIGPL